MPRRKKKRRKGRSFDRHHRLPSSRGGGNEERNISIVPSHEHRAFHLLFANKTAPEIAEVLNRIWIDPDFRLVAKPTPDYFRNRGVI